MLLQSLAQYADSRLQREQNDPAFEKKRVSYLLEIGWDGTFLGVTDCHGPIQPDQTERQPAPALLAPRSPGHRTGGVYPLLACDNAGYVLGFDRKHDAFVALLEEAAEATSDPALRSCVAFFRCPDGLSSARKCLATFNPPPGAWIALSVGGPVINRKVVRAYWRQTYARESHAMTESGRESMCLISGQIGPIARTHLKVKGITAVGGNPTGVSFASFGKKAHRSYGWRQAENSPVLPDRANAYILALNHLLKGESARVSIMAEFPLFLGRGYPSPQRRFWQLRIPAGRRLNLFSNCMRTGDGALPTICIFLAFPAIKAG